MADEVPGGETPDGKVRIHHASYDVGWDEGENDAYVTEEQFEVVWGPRGWKRRSETAVRRLERAEQ